MRCLERERDKRFANVAELAMALAPIGGPDAASSAARAARTQGVAAIAGGAAPDEHAASAKPDANGPEVGPASGRSDGHLSRSAAPAAISTLESANAAAAPSSQQPPSAIEAQPISARAQGTDRRHLGDGGLGDAQADPDRAPLARGGCGRWDRSPLSRAGSTRGSTSPRSTGRRATPRRPTRRSAPRRRLQPPPPRRGELRRGERAPTPSEPAADSTDAASASSVESPPQAHPSRRSVGAVPRPRATATVHDEPSVTAHPMIAPPVSPPAPTATAKPKRNPLDLDIK